MLGKILQQLTSEPQTADEIAKKCKTDASSVLKAINNEREGWWLVEKVIGKNGVLYKARNLVYGKQSPWLKRVLND